MIGHQVRSQDWAQHPLRGLLLCVAVLAATLAPTKAVAFTPTFEEVDCPRFVRSVPEGVLTCGYLTVLEEHADPTGPTIRNFVIFPTDFIHDPDLEPVFRPGRELNWVDGPVRWSGEPPPGYRAQIWMDPRGTGYSQPSISCPEIRGLVDPELGITLGTPEMESALLDAIQACHDRLTAEGIDLSAYNLGEMAADGEDLRIALGIDEWDLITYGSAGLIAYEMMRRFPEHIRAAVFDSPPAPDVDRFTQAVVGTERSVKLAAERCQRDERCNEAFPHVRQTWSRALRNLNAEPSQISDEGLAVVVDDATAVRYMRQALIEPPEVGEFPLAVTDLADHGWVNTEPAGDDAHWSANPPLALGYDIHREGVLNEAVFYSVMCHDDLPFVDGSAFAAAADGEPWYLEAYADDWYQEACDRWDVGQADLNPYRPLRSDIPTMIFVGRYDPYSPLPLIQRAARHLSTSWVVVLPTWSHHILSGDSDCPIVMRNIFWDHPRKAPDTSCIRDTRLPIPFQLPSSPAPNPDDPSIITTIAGNGVPHNATWGDGGPASQSTLEYPGDIDVDGQGNVYVWDNGGGLRVRRIDHSGLITTVAGPPEADVALAPPGDAADLVFAGGRGAVDAAGNVYVWGPGPILQRVTPSGEVTTIAGNGETGYTGDGGPAIEAALNSAGELFVDPAGNVYLGAGSRIRKIDASGTITTIAGTTKGFSGDGGPAVEAQLNGVTGISVDGTGNVYVVDDRNHRIRRIGTDGIITTVAGSGPEPQGKGRSCGPRRVAFGDGGPAAEAQLCAIDGIWVQPDGTIYLADYIDDRIRRIGTDGIITTIAGGKTYGFSGDGGPATGALLNEMEGVAVTPDGTIYIADSGNNRIRKVAVP